MAGGTGSRMGTSKKMFLEINGEKIIDRVVRILHRQNFRISLCISENTLFLQEYPEVRIVMGKGSYAEDLSFAVGMCSLPVLLFCLHHIPGRVDCKKFGIWKFLGNHYREPSGAST